MHAYAGEFLVESVGSEFINPGRKRTTFQSAEIWKGMVCFSGNSSLSSEEVQGGGISKEQEEKVGIR